MTSRRVPREGDEYESTNLPVTTEVTENVDAAHRFEASIPHSILHVVTHVAGAFIYVVAELIPDVTNVVNQVVDNVADVVGDIIKDVIVNVLVDIVKNIIFEREESDILDDLGLEPTLEGIQALVHKPATRELIAKRVAEAREQGKELALPSSRELAELINRYLDRASQRQRASQR